MGRLSGKVAIVTGASQGMGAAHAKAFVEAGAKVVLTDLNEVAGQALADSLGENAIFVKQDVSKQADWDKVLAAANAKFGVVTVLVNNAANDKRIAFDTLTEGDFDAMLSINFRHAVFASQAVLPGMRAAGGGAIVNMSSVAWMGGGREMEIYAAAKAAMVGFTNSLARDVGPDHIRVNAIAPGMIITPRQRELWFQDESQIAAGLSRQCLPDLIAVEDVANLALFLTADDSRSITKQCFMINGGSR